MRWRLYVRAAGYCAVASMVWLSAYVVLAQSPDVERRLSTLEAIRIDQRLSVLESQIDTLLKLGLAVAIGVCGQLIISAREAIGRRKS